MPRANEPFEDPEFLAELARLGITHRPGLAAEMMQQFEPLLMADGIDLNDPNAAFSGDELQAALDRATERHNLELVTPIGHRRELAAGLLRAFAVALAEGRDEDAQSLLQFASPDGGEDHPTIAHVIGVGIGLLDTWFSDAEVLPVIGAARAPKWRGSARATAKDLLALAAKNRAFSSLDSLILRPGSLVLQEAAALAVSACLLAVMAREHLDAEQAAARLFGGEGEEWQTPSSRPSFSRPGDGDPSRATELDLQAGGSRTGAAFGLGKRRGISPETLSEFGLWLDLPDTLLFSEAESTEQILDQFEALVGIAAQLGINLDEPASISRMLDVVFEFDDDRLQDALDLLHDYVHFRTSTGPDPEDWDEAHAVIEEAGDEPMPVPDELLDAIEFCDRLDPNVRLAALANTRVVSAVPELLAWLGKSQGVTPAGGIRRADIATVAAMIGVRAEGVAKIIDKEWHPPLDFDMNAPLPEPDVYYARSSLDIPTLAAWWEALQQAGLIERTATRIRPSYAAATWPVDGTFPPYADADMLVMVYVAEVLLEGVLESEWTFGLPVMIDAIARLMPAVTADVVDGDSDGASGHSGAPLTTLFAPRALRKISHLERVGIVETRDGAIRVPGPLRSTVGRAIIAAMRIAAQS